MSKNVAMEHIFWWKNIRIIHICVLQKLEMQRFYSTGWALSAMCDAHAFQLTSDHRLNRFLEYIVS